MKTYEKLLEEKRWGSLLSGELKDAKEDTDLESRELRSPQEKKEIFRSTYDSS